MKVRVAASSTVVSVLLALSTYGTRVDTAIYHLIGGQSRPATETRTAALNAPPRDYESRLSADFTAVDSVLPITPSIAIDAPTRLTLAVADGQTLAGVLSAADVSTGEAQAAVEAARGVYDPRKLRAGQFITVNFAAQGGAFRGFEIQADPEHLVTVAKGADGFAAQQIHLTLRSETHAARGLIKSSLFESAAEAGVPYAVTAAMIRAFSYDVDFQRDIQAGDRFKVMYNTMIGDGGERPGDVMFAELILSGKSHAIYGVRRDDGAVDFFTRDGKSVKKDLLRTPVDGAKLTSGFGMRMHPILGYTRMHKGVDFGAPTGTPIYAAGDGVIEQSGWAGGYGRFVMIKHDAHTETAYGHMSRIATAATMGARVHQGQVIGYVGMTGDATGPHLHYEVRKNGAQVNPISITGTVVAGLEGNALVSFLKTVDERETRYASLIDGTQFAAVVKAKR